MASPNGFTPYGKILSGKWYWKDTTAGKLTVGDEVVRVVSSSDTEGDAEVVRATVGAALTGVVVDVATISSNLHRQGVLEATESGRVFVSDSPYQIYSVVEAGSGTALAITDIGKHIDSITVASGSTARGRSVSAIDNNAKATDNTWIIVGLDPEPGNVVGGAGTKWLVRPNLHTEINAGASNIKEI